MKMKSKMGGRKATTPNSGKLPLYTKGMAVGDNDADDKPGAVRKPPSAKKAKR